MVISSILNVVIMGGSQIVVTFARQKNNKNIIFLYKLPKDHKSQEEKDNGLDNKKDERRLCWDKVE